VVGHNGAVAAVDPARRRRTPTQERARATVEAICAAAAELIEEGGLPALTTNAVARRAAVSITAVYAYFPDKWAIVHELFERFEVARATELAGLYEEFVVSEDWSGVIDRLWDRMAELRIETPAGVALRQAMLVSPPLANLDREGTLRAASSFSAAMLARDPAIDPDEAFRCSWTISLVAGPIIDDSVRDGSVHRRQLDDGKRMVIRHLEPLLGPAMTMPGERPRVADRPRSRGAATAG
jgi:AcrR family transcriptional regulator